MTEDRTDWDAAQQAMDEAGRQAWHRWGQASLVRGDRPSYYVLEGHEPRPVALLEWAANQSEDRAGRHVGDDTLPDGTRVSTVFLGLDLNHHPQGPPLLFETMVFPADGSPLEDVFCERYATWEQAEAGHAAVLARLRERSG